MELGHKIIVVGIGPGSPDYILPIAMQKIRAAKVLVGSKRALDAFATDSQVTKVIDKDIDGVLNFIKMQLASHEVIVMVSGDPGFYSMLAALNNFFEREVITVIPGISSAQLAFARLGEIWQDADLISMHGRRPADEILAHLPGKKLGILTDTKHNPASIAKILLASGWPADSKVWLCANLSYENEVVLAVDLAKAVETPGFDHSVMVVKA